MKKNFAIRVALLPLLCLLFAAAGAQDQPEKKTLSVSVSYFMDNNRLMYLEVMSRAKLENKFQPVGKIPVSVYLDEESDSALIARVITDEAGRARAILPPALKPKWDASNTHLLLGVAAETKDYSDASSETAVTKTKLAIDTTLGEEGRMIQVSVMRATDAGWEPAPDVEMRVGVRRHGGILSAGEEESYTTDSTGTVLVPFKKDSLPGDEKGNLVLSAKVEENDQYGNLLIERSVPWGLATRAPTDFFDQRTLWSTRFRAPFWLMFMAYSVMLGVWVTIIYLVLQIVKIYRLRLQD